MNISTKQNSSLSLLDKNAIDLIAKEYLKDDIPWYIGFSGGKDSSALIKLLKFRS